MWRGDRREAISLAACVKCRSPKDSCYPSVLEEVLKDTFQFSLVIDNDHSPCTARVHLPRSSTLLKSREDFFGEQWREDHRAFWRRSTVESCDCPNWDANGLSAHPRGAVDQDDLSTQTSRGDGTSHTADSSANDAEIGSEHLLLRSASTNDVRCDHRRFPPRASQPVGLRSALLPPRDS